MQIWQIVSIVLAAVIFVFAAAFIIGSLVTVKTVLGRKDDPYKNDPPEKYGVDLSWFDEVKDNTKTIKITAYDGIELGALLITHGDGVKKLAICQHGYRATPKSVQPHAKIFYDNGFDVLLPAARGHGISGGKYCGLAWLDRFDVMRWVNKGVEIYGADVSIALLGVSMGGSSVVAVAGMNPPPQVKCVIDDCGFSSQYDIYAERVKHIKLPATVSLAPLYVGVRLVCGYSLYDADIMQFAKAVKLPVLFIHGDRDGFVPYELGRKLFDACASHDKSFYTAEGATHAEAYAIDKEKYAATVTEFVNGHIAR